MFNKLVTIAAVSAIASVGYAGSAQAIGFSYSAGAYRNVANTSEVLSLNK
ncbi:MAG: hypothetical protein ACHBN1_13780 [Heteroscytonema crispum UTEX LB 1556]